jgi:hypothetical protein
MFSFSAVALCAMASKILKYYVLACCHPVAVQLIREEYIIPLNTKTCVYSFRCLVVTYLKQNRIRVPHVLAYGNLLI